MPICRCIVRACGNSSSGIDLSKRQWQEHQRDDLRARSEREIDQVANDPDVLAVEERVFRSTLLGPDPFPEHDVTPFHLPRPVSPGMKPPSDPGLTSQTTTTSADHLTTYSKLRWIENLVDDQANITASLLADVSLGHSIPQRVPELHPLRPQEEWFISTDTKLRPLLSSESLLIQQYCGAIIQRIDKQLALIKEHRDRWVEPSVQHYDTGRFFTHTLQHADSLLIASLLLAVILNILGGVSRRFANFSLRSHKLLVEMAFEKSINGNRIPADQEQFIKAHPVDIRTARKQFDLEPTLTIYACCPRCSCIYAPVRGSSGKPSYPEHCTYNPLPDDPLSSPCTEPLLEKRPQGEQALRRPFAFQDPKDWLAGLLSRPGVEELLDSAWDHKANSQSKDIFDADVVRNFQGSDGKPFRICPDSEGRYIFALSVDWYNPFTNKSAGLHASVGAISMVCLNLPPLIRYKWENMYLVGLIPGPSEPSLEETDHFLVPLIRIFAEFWNPGIFFNQTARYPRGRRVRCAILPFVADMQASRKTLGSRRCQLCRTNRKEVVSGSHLEPSLWKRLSPDEYRAIAERWRDAPTLKQRADIYEKEGIRWSILLDLPYWTPVIFGTIDPMHALFLGLIATHFRHIYAMDSKGASKMEQARKEGQEIESKIKPLDADNLAKGQGILMSGDPSKAAVGRLLHSTLSALCQTYEVPMSKNLRGQFTKKTMTDDLFGWRKTQNPFVPRPSAPLSMQVNVLNHNLSNAIISGHEILEIRKDISRTILPTWLPRISTLFGSKGSGKMKADEWRVAATVHLPITLIRLWGYPGSSKAPFLENTMNLVSAVILATSYATSRKHGAAYTQYMKAYQTGLKSLFPDINFRPNHHVALHLEELLRAFGPVHAWWMFPFERVIGRLEKIKTNWKLGQLELTMMTAFCASTNIRALLTYAHIPAVTRCANLLQKSFPEGVSGLFANLQGKAKEEEEISVTRVERLLADVHGALAMYLRCNAAQLNRNAVNVKRITHNGYSYAVASATIGDSLVMFHPTGSSRAIPGRISQIFNHTRKSTAEHGIVQENFVAIQRYISPDDVNDPFSAFPVFRAGLYRSTLETSVEIIRLTDIWCHFALCPYDGTCSVVVPLDRQHPRELD